MEPASEGFPRAEIKVDGRKIVRTEVDNDWGSRMQWKVMFNEETSATPNARGELVYEHPSREPGRYEFWLEMWRYDGFRNGTLGEYVIISNQVGYTI